MNLLSAKKILFFLGVLLIIFTGCSEKSSSVSLIRALGYNGELVELVVICDNPTGYTLEISEYRDIQAILDKISNVNDLVISEHKEEVGTKFTIKLYTTKDTYSFNIDLTEDYAILYVNDDSYACHDLSIGTLTTALSDELFKAIWSEHYGGSN